MTSRIITCVCTNSPTPAAIVTGNPYIHGRLWVNNLEPVKPHTHTHIYVACNLRTCAVCRLHGAKYAVCRLHDTQSADCMATVQTNSFSKFQRNLRFSARINFLTKLRNLKENNLCLFDNGYYSFSCIGGNNDKFVCTEWTVVVTN